MPNLHLLLGPPGTGKTTTLLAKVRAFLATRAPTDVAFVSFTNAATAVATERVAEATGREAAEFPHFRTVHSLAFRGLGLSRDDVFDHRSLAEFAERIGEPISRVTAREPGEHGLTVGDAYLRAVDIARATGCSVEDAWLMADDLVPGTTAHGAAQFAEAYQAFKRQIGQLDFADMLTRYAEHGPPLAVKLAVVDEAQDLTAAQWAVVRRAFAGAETMVVAGDDDQAIYEWAGAALPIFLALGANATDVEVLQQSHRLPVAVWELAQDVAYRIQRRYAKQFRPRAEPGCVYHHGSLDSVPFAPDTRVLARNAYLLDDVEHRLRRDGIVYTRDGRPSVMPSDVETIKHWIVAGRHPGQFETTGAGIKAFCAALGRPAPSVKRHGTETLDRWQIDPTQAPWHEAFVGWSQERRDYYRTVLDNGNKLSAPPTVHLSTIHAAKGTEARHVVLLTDVSGRTAQKLHTDAEHRVFYVGVTRASETLHIVAPYAGAGYAL
jgi:DNA helicase-2/ATP-dependent DNA helicase PcrA